MLQCVDELYFIPFLSGACEPGWVVDSSDGIFLYLRVISARA